MDGPGHEGVVARLVAEDHELGRPEAALVAGLFGQFLDGPADHRQGVHVDALLAGGDIDRGADLLGLGQGLGDRGDVFPVGGGHAFFHLGGEAAEDIDADGGGGPVEALGQLDEAVPVETGADKGDGGHRYPLVDHRDAEFPADGIAGRDEIPGKIEYSLLDPLAGALDIAGAAVEDVDAHGDGADIEVFLLNHLDGGEDLV